MSGSQKESEGHESICSSKALQSRVISLAEHEAQLLWQRDSNTSSFLIYLSQKFWYDF